MGILQSTTQTYSFKPDEIKKLIAADLNVDANNVKVNFVIQEVGGDPMDRFRGTPKVVGVEVTVTK